MPLSPPAPRQLKHRRRIECDGYQRDDGLWDIEATLHDSKSYPFNNRARGEIQPGEPLHLMMLRISVDNDMLVHAIETVTDASPFQICPEINSRFTALQGHRIAPGWSRLVRQQLGGVKGCTHLVDLLAVAATIAYQTIMPLRDKNGGSPPDPNAKPRLLNSCHAFASDGEVVRIQWPKFYRGAENSDTK